jgi:acyl dehydratase
MWSKMARSSQPIEPKVRLNVTHSVQKLPTIAELGPLRVLREQMLAFSQRFDPQPFHLDASAAAETLLGGLAASAWYVCAKIDELLRKELAAHHLTANVTGAEQIVLLVPVRAGDRLAIRVHFKGGAPCRCGRTGTEIAAEVMNQGGECVARMALSCAIGVGRDVPSEDFELCGFRQGRQARAQWRHRINVIRYFDDIEIGDEIDLGGYRFGKAEVDDYTWRVSNHDFQDNATAGIDFVPPWHIPSAWMQCMVQYYGTEAVRLKACKQPVPQLGPAAGIKHLRWRRPVTIGETIHFRGWAERKLAIPTQKNWGLLVVGAEGFDAAGDLVISFFPQMLMEREVLSKTA